VLFGLLADAPDGALWLSTENGIARFDPAADLAEGGKSNSGAAWTIYTVNEGLVSNFSAMAFGPAGEIWFGTTRFQPEEADIR
jgi:ligand-binding sensor domain-containing protein